MDEPPDPILDLLGEPAPAPELIEFELVDRPDVTVGAISLDLLGFDEEPDDLQVGGPGPIGTRPLEPVETVSYDPLKDREGVRGKLALSLVAILAFIVFGAFVSLLTGWGGSDQTASKQAEQVFAGEALAQQGTSPQNTPGAGTQEAPPPEGTPSTEVPPLVVTAAPQQSGLAILLQIILSPIVGLVGAATGFYFGGLSGKSEA